MHCSVRCLVAHSFRPLWAMGASPAQGFGGFSYSGANSGRTKKVIAFFMGERAIPHRPYSLCAIRTPGDMTHRAVSFCSKAPHLHRRSGIHSCAVSASGSNYDKSTIWGTTYSRSLGGVVGSEEWINREY